MREGQSDLQRRCRWLRTLATGFTFCFLFVLAIDAGFAVGSENRWEDLITMAVYRLPVVIYLAGIWTVRSAFARLAAGDMFGEVLPVLLRRLGWALALGGIASVFVVQWLVRLLRGSADGSWATFDPAAITVGLVGLLLIVLADLIRRAESIKRELDEFF